MDFSQTLFWKSILLAGACQPEPYLYQLVCAHIPSEPDHALHSCPGHHLARLLCLMGVCRTRCAGDLQPAPILSPQEHTISMVFVQMQPSSHSKGSACPLCASTLELDKAKLATLHNYSYHLPPRLDLPTVCLLIEGRESPAPSLLYSLTSPQLSRESHYSWPCPGVSFCSSSPNCPSICGQRTQCWSVTNGIAVARAKTCQFARTAPLPQHRYLQRLNYHPKKYWTLKIAYNLFISQKVV